MTHPVNATFLAQFLLLLLENKAMDAWSMAKRGMEVCLSSGIEVPALRHINEDKHE